MSLLLYLGVPPSIAVPLMIWTAQAQMLRMIVACRYLQELERRRHLALSPGEQYRRTLQSGGYRP